MQWGSTILFGIKIIIGLKSVNSVDNNLVDRYSALVNQLQLKDTSM